MYESHYHLNEKPFSLTPDPTFLYLSRYHRQGVNILEYILAEQAGIALISGEVGSGKTTLIRYLLRLLDHRVNVAVISNTHRSMGGLLKRILAGFNLDYTSDDPVELYQRFERFLASEAAQGRRAVLIFDEAQNLSIDALEEMRLISNINTTKKPVVQIILSGQPEILTSLALPELRQFSQRISAIVYLHQLTVAETLGYIRHRIRVAGGEPGIISPEACAAVHVCSRGLPRLINQICEMTLIYGFGEGLYTLDAQTVLEACEAMRLGDFATLRDDEEATARVRRRLSEEIAVITEQLERAVSEMEIEESANAERYAQRPALQRRTEDSYSLPSTPKKLNGHYTNGTHATAAHSAAAHATAAQATSAPAPATPSTAAPESKVQPFYSDKTDGRKKRREPESAISMKTMIVVSLTLTLLVVIARLII